MQEGLVILGEASTGQEAIEMARRLKPAVVLLDLRLPDLDGISVCEEIKKENPDVQVLVLTTFDDDQDIFGALDAGASSYVLKDVAPSDLVEAIRSVADGKMTLDPAIARRVIGRRSRDRLEPEGSALSRREIEVLELMASGLKNKQIAEALWISQTTVKTHVSHILQKLNTADRTQAILTAMKKGLVKVPKDEGR